MFYGFANGVIQPVRKLSGCDAKAGIRSHPGERAFRGLSENSVRCFPEGEECVIEFGALFSHLAGYEAQSLFESLCIGWQIATATAVLVKSCLKGRRDCLAQCANLSGCGTGSEAPSFIEPGKKFLVEKIIEKSGLLRK